jgi:hypothetical protein
MTDPISNLCSEFESIDFSSKIVHGFIDMYIDIYIIQFCKNFVKALLSIGVLHSGNNVEYRFVGPYLV